MKKKNQTNNIFINVNQKKIMNKKEIKAYVARCITGQGNQVDLGSGLGDVLISLADLLPDPEDIEVNHYLTFRTADAQENSVKIVKNGDAPSLTLYYSRNAKDWFKWKNYSSDELKFSSDKPLYLCGSNQSMATYTYTALANQFVFGNNNGVYCSGSIMSILNYRDFLLTISSGHCFEKLFQGCTALVQAPELPATTLSSNCYQSMFQGCTALVQAPELPATIAPTLCYNAMFQGCTALVQAPELPATTLSNNCYNAMFQGCTALVQAPELPATILVSQCYELMFKDCTALNYVKCLATDISANRCTQDWLSNVSPTGTFVKVADVEWTEGANGIPTGWTVEEVV